MTTTERVVLAQRLGEAEAELQAAMRGLDGSHGARTRLAVAREEHRAAEAQALAVLAGQHVLGDAANVDQYRPPGPLTLSGFEPLTGM
ncbi:hypothetical protein [Corallococcus sp. AS-1-6]|uniref:hypothetical protein n=1 Tax=Corallococcus sp. AS-1-6 TaxID=2874599 RepID=UPI001CBA8E09|nr:hypothetical protein [Corallococcus sp. AS-1-6]MBZ4371493.1 hypothetical protein [Corallococcus sp. AS-1-6]